MSEEIGEKNFEIICETSSFAPLENYLSFSLSLSLRLCKNRRHMTSGWQILLIFRANFLYLVKKKKWGNYHSQKQENYTIYMDEESGTDREMQDVSRGIAEDRTGACFFARIWSLRLIWFGLGTSKGVQMTEFSHVDCSLLLNLAGFEYSRVDAWFKLDWRSWVYRKIIRFMP